jgi:hypothetical protein
MNGAPGLFCHKLGYFSTSTRLLPRQDESCNGFVTILVTNRETDDG